MVANLAIPSRIDQTAAIEGKSASDIHRAIASPVQYPQNLKGIGMRSSALGLRRNELRVQTPGAAWNEMLAPKPVS